MKKSEAKNDGTKIVRGKYSKKYWIENSKGRRISEKFDIINTEDVNRKGFFRIINTDKGIYIINKYVDHIIYHDSSDSIYFFCEHGQYYLLFCYTRHKYYIFNKYGEKIKQNLEDMTFWLGSDMIKFKQQGKWRLMNLHSGNEISLIFNEIGPLNKNDYAVVNISKKEGKAIINKRGSYVIEPDNYEDIEFISENLLKVIKDNKVGVMTLDKKTIIPIDYGNVELISENSLKVMKDKKVGIISLNKEMIVPIEYDEVIFKNGYYIVQIGSQYGLLDSKGNIVFECIYPEIIETPDKFVVTDFLRKEVPKVKQADKK